MAPALIVIGGLNRAGKTTFMQVLRYLGYGFPLKAGLPPAHSKYEAEADLRVGEAIFHLGLRGHGEPRLSLTSGSAAGLETAQELYRLDSFTYRQLFTITLDELRGDQGLSTAEQRTLQSILVGAGCQDLLALPALQAEFHSSANKIGGKRGDPNVSDFRIYYERIREGQAQRRKGQAQVEEYQTRQLELSETEREIGAVTRELEELSRAVIRLDLVKNNFATFLSLEELAYELELKQGDHWENAPGVEGLERVQSLREEWRSLSAELRQQELSLNLTAATRELLLHEHSSFGSLLEEVSGIRERISLQHQIREDWAAKKQDLDLRIGEVNLAWVGADYDKISSVRTDIPLQDQLSATIEEHRELTLKSEKCVAELASLRAEKEALDEQSEILQADQLRPKWPVLFAFLALSAGLGMALALLNPVWGLLLGLVGAVGTSVYFLVGWRMSGAAASILQKQGERSASLQAGISVAQNALGQLESSLQDKVAALAGYSAMLELEPDFPQAMLPGQVLRVRGLQDKIQELGALNSRLKRVSQDLDLQYQSYVDFLGQFDPQIASSCAEQPGSSSANWAQVIDHLNEWQGYLQTAQDLKILEARCQELQHKITSIMARSAVKCDEGSDLEHEVELFLTRGRRAQEFQSAQKKHEEKVHTLLSSLSSDTVREAFGWAESASKQSLLEQFRAECKACGIQLAAEDAHKQAAQNKDQKTQELEILQEKRRKLSADLLDLAAPEQLFEGQRKIDQGREELRVLAQKYAVNLVAAFLLQEAKQDLLQGMKDSIMDSAGQIFRRMTGGDYQGVLPAESLLKPEFEAILEESAAAQTAEMLSRATAEQLYLAVRLSRILEIEPRLPIIIDDSLANFDSRHLHQALAILNEVAATHQIFMLTCHAELVQAIARRGSGAQYWRLERGRFARSTAPDLVDYLQLEEQKGGLADA